MYWRGSLLLNSCLHGATRLPRWAEPQSPSYQRHSGILHFSSKFQSHLKKLSPQGISLALGLCGRTSSKKHFAQRARHLTLYMLWIKTQGFITKGKCHRGRNGTLRTALSTLGELRCAPVLIAHLLSAPTFSFFLFVMAYTSCVALDTILILPQGLLLFYIFLPSDS